MIQRDLLHRRRGLQGLRAAEVARQALHAGQPAREARRDGLVALRSRLGLQGRDEHLPRAATVLTPRDNTARQREL